MVETVASASGRGALIRAGTGHTAALTRKSDIDPCSPRAALGLGVVMFFLGALLNRFVWGDGFDWGEAAAIAACSAGFLALVGHLQRPQSTQQRSDDR